MRVTMTNTKREFYTFIGKSGGVQRKSVVVSAVKRVYCSDCLTTHEEGQHLVKEVK